MRKSIKYFAGVLLSIFTSLDSFAQSASTQKPVDELVLWMLGGFGLLFLIIVLVLNGVIRSMAGNNLLWKPKTGKTAGGVAVLAGVLFSTSAHAVSADAPVFGIFQGYSNFFWLLVIIDLSLVFIIIFQLRVFRKLIVAINPPDEVEETVLAVAEVAPRKSWIKQLMQKMNRSVPVEQEEEVMTEHEYDGIRELDNVLPPWWVAMFYATIIFSGAYLAHYHLFKTGDLQIAEYQKSIEEAEKEIEAYMATVAAQVDENTVTLVTDASLLSQGEKIYSSNCAACHGTEGQGGVGPNFADEYWIHGGSVNDVFSVIKYGVPSKGMISWKAQLAPVDIQNVASYLLTFQGTNPPNPKEPQGELYVPDVSVDGEETEMITTKNNSTGADSL